MAGVGILVTMALLASQAGTPSTPLLPGTMKVRVVDATTGAPLPGVSVSFLCFRSDFAFQQYQGSTDGNGEMSSAVTPGECAMMSSQLRGYSQQSTGRRYEVAAGETVTVVRRLQRLASVSGTVLDEQRAPLAGVKVFIQRRIVVAGELQWWNSQAGFVVTDDNGRFTDPTFAAGIAYRLHVPALELTEPSEAIVLAAGESRVVSLTGRKLPVFDVSGHVRRPGVNLGFVTVWLDRAESSPGRAITVADARADASGAFVFRQIPKGAYRIRVDTGASTVNNYSPSDILTALQPITIDRSIDDLVVPLMPGNEVSGRVRFEGPTPAPANFVGVSIQFAAANGRLPTAPPQSRPSSAQGTVGSNFWTRALPPGQYVVSGHSLAGDWRLKSAMLDGVDITDVPFDSSRGRVFDIVVTLTDRHTEMRGTVRDALGQEVPEATVAIFPTDSRLWTSTSGRRMRLLDATQRGRYYERDMPPGEYFAAAVRSSDVPFDGAVADVEWLRRIAATAQRVRLEEDVPLVLNLVVR